MVRQPRNGQSAQQFHAPNPTQLASPLPSVTSPSPALTQAQVMAQMITQAHGNPHGQAHAAAHMMQVLGNPQGQTQAAAQMIQVMAQQQAAQVAQAQMPAMQAAPNATNFSMQGAMDPMAAASFQSPVASPNPFAQQFHSPNPMASPLPSGTSPSPAFTQAQAMAQMITQAHGNPHGQAQAAAQMMQAHGNPQGQAQAAAQMMQVMTAQHHAQSAAEVMSAQHHAQAAAEVMTAQHHAQAAAEARWNITASVKREVENYSMHAVSKAVEDDWMFGTRDTVPIGETLAKTLAPSTGAHPKKRHCAEAQMPAAMQS
ncbi:unnamed protein product [Durusdinium trenchii]|uniref:Uncharacterized protein n=1 Tax=Durusdinium trenchii TaxID=1381693 RepID=A0ABP0QZZ3_9DINO